MVVELKGSGRKFLIALFYFFCNAKFVNSQNYFNLCAVSCFKQYSDSIAKTMTTEMHMKKKVCWIISDPSFAEWFLLDQLRSMRELYDVVVVSNTSNIDFLLAAGIPVRVISIKIERRINLFIDIRALFYLIRLFYVESFDVVHSFTPKPGLLSMLAAWFARVPIRIHTFTGQVWGTRTGLMRSILKVADRLTVWAATNILVDSFSQREFLIQESVAKENKLKVLANGSLSGVDIFRFAPNVSHRLMIRARFNINNDALVFLYMARLTRDKGALVIAEGFSKYGLINQLTHLIVVGPDEEGLLPQMQTILSVVANRVHFEGATRAPEQFMAAADVFCLPSYREGFGLVLINAAATGIPAIASKIYGSEEAVIDGVTGLLHEAGNISDLVKKMDRLATDGQLRSELGANARMRVAKDFSQTLVTQSVMDFYESFFIKADCRHGS